MPSKTSSFLLFLGLGILLVVWSTEVEGFPSGAPRFACRSGRPNHNEDVQPHQTFPVQVFFLPDRAMPGQTVDVFVWVKDVTDRFEGMLVTARPIHSQDKLVGGFTPINGSSLRALQCTSSAGANSALTHGTRLNTDHVWFRWTVPRDASVRDIFLIRFTVVQNFTLYWVGVDRPFIVGAPTLRPIDLMTSDPSRSSGGQTGPEVGPGAGARKSPGRDTGASTQNGQTVQHTGVSSGNGQQTGASSMAGQQTHAPSSRGQQDGRRPTAGVTQQLSRVSTTGRDRFSQQAPPPRTPSSSSGGRAPMSPSSSSSQQASPPRTPSSSSGGRAPMSPSSSSSPLVANAGASAGSGSGSGSSRNPQSGSPNPARGSGSPNTQPGAGNNPAGFMPVPGTRSSQSASGQEPVPQTNSVAGVQPPTARTNTLPEGQGREQRGRGSTNSGRKEVAGGGGGGMSAWVSGWFG